MTGKEVSEGELSLQLNVIAKKLSHNQFLTAEKVECVLPYPRVLHLW